MTTPTSCAATSPDSAEGGTIVTPLELQMWGDEFGMLVDRFGVGWMVNIARHRRGRASGAG